MPAHRIRQHMSDLKMLADLLGEVADRLPRTQVSERLDPQAVATIGVALPRLSETCDALFETLAEANCLASSIADQGTAAVKRQMSS